jgi:hypothetical protein
VDDKHSKTENTSKTVTLEEASYGRTDLLMFGYEDRERERERDKKRERERAEPETVCVVANHDRKLNWSSSNRARRHRLNECFVQIPQAPLFMSCTAPKVRVGATVCRAHPPTHTFARALVRRRKLRPDDSKRLSLSLSLSSFLSWPAVSSRIGF